jgi:diguanylate cyclase (GGDEF)-like protein
MQIQRVNRACILGAGLFLYMVVCAVAFSLGFIEITLFQFSALFTIGVVGVFCFLGIIYLELNLSFNDPDLSLVQMMWAITLVLAGAWFATDMKPLIIMTGLSLIMMGTNRLDGRALLMFKVFGISMYVLLLALENARQPAQIVWDSEVITLTAYSLALMFGPALIRREKSVLQDELIDRNQKLAEALSKSNSLAIRDELTGSFNQRHLVELLVHQKAMADRRDYIFSICCIDLDRFKRVNYLFGNHIGDMVLKNFARISESVVREVDCVARLEGEEFVVVLGGSSEQDALVVANRIRSLLQELEISPDKPEYRITASAGIAQYRPTESTEDLMKRAAYSLYRAKRSGRDAVIIAESDAEVLRVG